VVISVASIMIAIRSAKKQTNTQAWITNLQLLNRATGMLIADHGLLKIIGIEPEEIMKDGISPSEIVFINASLDASEAMYLISGDKSITEFRKNFLRNAKVRTAWKKYLKNKAFSPSPWADAVDKYITNFESKGNAPQTKEA